MTDNENAKAMAENKCVHYDAELDVCRLKSDWCDPMPVLQPCVDSPCADYDERGDRMDFCGVLCKFAEDIIKRQREEIEEHKRAFETILKEVRAAKALYAEDIRRAKTEAIKEFAERLKEGHDQCDGEEDVPWLIDKLVKEKTEERKQNDYFEARYCY